MEPGEVKSALPIPFVLDRAGIAYEVGADGRCHARCPWHDDSHPSFDVFGPTLGRWRCSPCGVGGDVFDLLERLGLAECFADAVELGEWMVGLLREAEWAGPTAALPRREFDFGAAARVVLQSREDLDGLADFLYARDDMPPWEAGELHRQWAVGSVGTRVIIPYFDGNGNLMAYKHRTPGTKPISASGAHFTDLYGAWRDDRKAPVLLVEGESDAWAADWWVGDRWAVLGVPNGAGTTPTPELLDRLEGRMVRIAFDGDDAGFKGAVQWARACKGLLVPMPFGMDVATVGSGIGQLIHQSAAYWPRVGMRPTPLPSAP